MSEKCYEGLIDSHFHLPLLREAASILSELFEGHFAGGINICLSEEDLLFSKPLTEGHDQIVTACGYGPWEFENGEPEISVLIDSLKRLFEEHHFRFLGEFGLDYHWNYGTPEMQKALMEAEIELAEQLKLPIIIHNRDAASDTLSLIESHNFPNSGIIHCFSCDKEAAFKFLDKGFYLSFAGNITFKHTETLHEVLRVMPKDRLLLETDSPYLTPVPHRGQMNDMRNMKDIYAFTASLLGVETGHLISQVKSNFETLIG